MANQMTFERYEYKYLISRQQKALILGAMEEYMIPDRFGRSAIRNLYYDTPDFRLIRESLCQPLYKEKLRLRCYGSAGQDTEVFLELKKKYDGIVYKRRIALPLHQAMACTEGAASLPDSQIGREIQTALDYYRTLSPAIYLSYDREAFASRDGSPFRVTFDENIRYRWDRLDLTEPPSGARLLPPDTVLMELKIPGAMPFWMARLLSENGICKTSYSKYGAAYTQWLQTQQKGNQKYA